MYSKELEQLLSTKYSCTDINGFTKKYIEENFLKEPNESQKLEILKLEAEHIKKEIKGYCL